MNAACTSCHADVAEEWASSLHRSAFRDRAFQRGHAEEPRAFCVRCHAPESDPASTTPDAWAADHGVACTSCHGRTPNEAHANAKDAAALTTRACAGCHEFGFPDDERTARAAPPSAPPERMMQRTASEHAASANAAASCASCHMPKVGAGPVRHASHRFGITRDPTGLRAALDVRATRDAGTVTLTLTPRGVGHAFPTGDLFRRLRVVVEAEGDDGATSARFERRLARRFDVVKGKKVEVADTRLLGETSVRFELPASARAAKIRYRVSYERLVLAPMTPDRLRHDEGVEESVVLASGRLP